jgi:hypothetical protein
LILAESSTTSNTSQEMPVIINYKDTGLHSSTNDEDIALSIILIPRESGSAPYFKL